MSLSPGSPGAISRDHFGACKVAGKVEGREEAEEGATELAGGRGPNV